MLKVDTSSLLKSLEQAQQEIERKMQGMLGKFMYNFTVSAVQHTPFGNDAPAPNGFQKLYLERTPPMPTEAGMSRANWQIMNTGNFNPIYIADITGKPSLDDAKETFYRLGETYYLGNATPYIGLLENNYSIQTAGQGITAPTIDDVMTIYQYRLDDYYKQS